MVKQRHEQITENLQRDGKITGADAKTNSINRMHEFPDLVEKADLDSLFGLAARQTLHGDLPSSRKYIFSLFVITRSLMRFGKKKIRKK